MPRVYILPDLYIYDRDVPSNFLATSKYYSAPRSTRIDISTTPYSHGSFTKYAEIVGDWKDQLYGNCSEHDYSIYLDGKPIDIPVKINKWGLFSFEVTPGAHTISVSAYQKSTYDTTRFYVNPVTQERNYHFKDKYVKKKHEFTKTIDFSVQSGNAFFHFLLGFTQYYPMLWAYEEDAPVRIPSRELYPAYETVPVFFHDKYVKYAERHLFMFDQITFDDLKRYMSQRAKREHCWTYNEAMPQEDGVTNLTAKKPIANSSAKPTSSGVSNGGVTSQANSSSSKPLSIAEQAKAQGKTIAQFIGDRPEPIKPRKRIVKKEVIVKEKYYDSEKFEESMEGFEYHVSGDEVILTKVLKSCAELVIPDGVTVIKENALGKYLDSEIIKLPYSLKVLEKGAFKSNTRVQKVVLESQIDTIEEETFMDCKNLQEVILPPTVKSIKSRAFQGAKLKSIFVRSDILIEKDAFDENVILDDGTLSESEKVNLVIDGFITELLAINPKKGEFVSKLQKQLKSVEEKESANFEVFKVQKQQEFLKNKEDYLVSEKIKSLQDQIQEIELQIDALSKN